LECWGNCRSRKAVNRLGVFGKGLAAKCPVNLTQAPGEIVGKDKGL